MDVDVLPVGVTGAGSSDGAVVLEPAAVHALVALLQADGRTVVGPRCRGDVIELAELGSTDDLPVGLGTDLAPGSQRLRVRDDAAWFGYAVGPASPKRWLLPPRRLLWRATRNAEGFTVFEPVPDPPPLAFVGVRPCEVAAMERLDQVLDGPHADPDYAARRAAAVVVTVACHAPSPTCFCASAGTGPGLPQDGDDGRGSFDLGLVELLDGEHRFLARAGSPVGDALLAQLPHRPAEPSDLAAASAQAEAAAAAQVRRLPGEQGRAGGRVLAEALAGAADSPHWASVGERCLACTSCTQVCPTCFCHTVEDTTDLLGQQAEHWRRWDSCFTGDFSRLHGGSVRTSIASRYRQWLSHKLGTWWDQFGTSGCVGCGRCIVWCPVGIDLTAEAHTVTAVTAATRAPGPRQPSPSDLSGAVIT